MKSLFLIGILLGNSILASNTYFDRAKKAFEKATPLSNDIFEKVIRTLTEGDAVLITTRCVDSLRSDVAFLDSFQMYFLKDMVIGDQMVFRYFPHANLETAIHEIDGETVIPFDEDRALTIRALPVSSTNEINIIGFYPYTKAHSVICWSIK